MSDGAALGQRSNQDHEEGDDEKDANTAQSPFVSFLPESLGQALEELGNGEFGQPDTRHGLVMACKFKGQRCVQQGVEDPRCKDHLRADYAMADFGRIGQVGRVDIVCAIDQNNVNKAHACKKRKDAEGHDLVLAEQAFIANVAARQADGYDDSGEDSAPPTVQKSGVVGQASSGLWGGRAVDTARYDHSAVEQSVQTLASAEGGAVWNVACSVSAMGDSGSGDGCRIVGWRRMDHFAIPGDVGGVPRSRKRGVQVQVESVEGGTASLERNVEDRSTRRREVRREVKRKARQPMSGR